MTLISIKKTAVVEPAPTGTVSLYVDSADSHLKQIDEAGTIIDLTDGSAISGTWTPTVSGIVGAATVDIIGVSRYFQIGNTAVDTCTVYIIFDTLQITETFFIDMAIPPSSNFANAAQVLPIQSFKTPSSEVDSCTIKSASGAKTTQVEVKMNGAGLNSIFTIQRTYSIL